MVTAGMLLLVVCIALAAAAPKSPLDLRVTRALGPKGYNMMRVSVISNTSSPVTSPLFTYTQPFKYRWTSKYLSSGIVSVKPGTATTITIQGVPITINLPAETSGSRGIVIGDPCFSNKWVDCQYGDKLQVLPRLTTLLNLAVATGDIDYWMILGDNFYDRTGEITQQFFDELELKTKSAVFASVPGNHDYWVHGAPILAEGSDQYSNGFLQFYPQDTIASANSSTFIDFSVDPDKELITDKKKPAKANSVWYNKIGNIGYLGYSGAYTYNDILPYFTEACAWFEQSKAEVVFLTGHWNSDADGCQTDMDVPSAYQKVKLLPGCSSFGNRFKYIMGHQHCNEVTYKEQGLATGFMVAGQGMEGCGNFGLPVVDTTDGQLRVWYYPIADATAGTDNYQALHDCFAKGSVVNCEPLATLFLNQTLTA